MIIANFMDSSLHALGEKGNLETVPELYNPGKGFDKVIHFTPHPEDVSLQSLFTPWNIEIVSYDGAIFRPFPALRSFIRIFREMRGRNIDLVRGRLPYQGSLFGCAAAKLLGIPSVVSLGGDNRLSQEATGQFHYKYRYISYRMEEIVLRLCSAIIAPNLFTKRYVASLIGERRAARKTKVIPWPCEEIPPSGRAEPDIFKKFGLPREASIFPIIGFINEYKYSQVLFSALEEWRPLGDHNVVFVFCGDGPLRGEGEKRFGGSPHVRFVGWQPRPVVHALIRRAATVLIPMSGFVLLETASLGRPVVTSKVEWHSELVKDGHTGLLVDPSDPGQWRRAIQRLLDDPERAAGLGRALKKRFDEDYSPYQSIQLERELYERLTRKTHA